MKYSKVLKGIEVMFKGPAGKIEARFHHNDIKNAPVAIIFHPHPLHGGTMYNEVVNVVFNTFVELGCSVIVPNLRGSAGNTEGSFDQVGVLMDASRTVDFIQDRMPDATGIWVVGFGFGCKLGGEILMRRPETVGFIFIAPLADTYDFSYISPCPTSGLIIQAMDDEICSEESSFRLYERLNKQRGIEVTYHVIEKTDHMFKGKFDELASTVREYLESHINDEQVIHPIKKDRRKRQNPIQYNKV